jgi:MFS family permease
MNGPAPSPAAYRWRLTALSLGMLLPSLGTSIANVALPSLGHSFAADFAQVQWVVISYLLAVTTLIVGAGRLGDMFGRRRMLLSGIAIFTIASLACAVAPSLWFLIGARALQGAGAAFMMSLTIASVTDALPRERTGRAMGLLGTVSAIGTALGPSLGGMLVAWAGWPAVFAVMAAAGAASFAVGLRVFARGAGPSTERRHFDVAGFLLLALALGAYCLSVTVAFFAIACTVAAVAALMLFVAVELRVSAPLVSVSSLRDRALGGSLAALALVTTIVMATLVVGPFYLTGAGGLNAAQAGLTMSIGPAVSALVGVPAGRLVDRLGARRSILSGLALSLAGCLLMVVLPALVGVIGYATALVLITGGYALFQAANNTSVMHSAPEARRGVISALLGLSRNLGLVTGASAMGAVYAIASNGLPLLAMPEGSVAGLQATFAIGAALAAASIWLTLAASTHPTTRPVGNADDSV